MSPWGCLNFALPLLRQWGFCRSKNVGSRQDFLPNRLWLEGRPRTEARINENSSGLGRNGDSTEAFLHVSPKALAFLIKNSILWRLNLFKIEHAWTGSVWTQAINTCSLQVRIPLAGHKTVLFPFHSPWHLRCKGEPVSLLTVHLRGHIWVKQCLLVTEKEQRATGTQ